MTDNSPMMTRGLYVDPHATVVQRDGGLETARALRLMAVLGIASRLFFIYASANRISVSHALLGLIGANGEVDLSDQRDVADLVSRGHDADGLVTFALVVSAIV